MTRKLHKDLSDPVPVPEAGIKRAVEIMNSGRLFRYGEFSGTESEVAALEREFADYMACDYAAALNSCGSAMFVALKCASVTPGDKVLVNAFTLAPVPGAIEHAGAEPVFVESAADFRIDLNDLESKLSSGAGVLLLSHMRGHIADMDAIRALCTEHGICLIEDCAHTLGASWNGRLSGSFGDISCFSLQTFKHINAGEGGILTTNDPDIAAKAILYSGSYMLYAQNGARPPVTVFEKYRYSIPNFSMRMQETTAALARPQIPLLNERTARWRKLYSRLAGRLQEVDGISVPERTEAEEFVPSSIQFSIPELDAVGMANVMRDCSENGVAIKWFGASEPSGFTSTADHWRYVGNRQMLGNTDDLLATLCDLRIPQSLTESECDTIAEVIAAAVKAVAIASPNRSAPGCPKG